MFLRILYESLIRQRRRKALASIAILLGTTCVTAMLALATTIGDRIHQELAVYGANIVVTPKAAQLDIKIGGVDVKPATGEAYLHESDLAKLKTIFWANNITGVSPELRFDLKLTGMPGQPTVPALGVWFNHQFSDAAPHTGAMALHPWWKISGRWPWDRADRKLGTEPDVVLGSALAVRLNKRVGDTVEILPNHKVVGAGSERGIIDGPDYVVSGIIRTGGAEDNAIIMPLYAAQYLLVLQSSQSGPSLSPPDAITRVDISARTKPEDAFARVDPDTLSPSQREIWYCRPYANSIAYQIREAIPGADAQQIRKVEQSEGTVLARISGLMWLISAAALLAAGFAVASAMANSILERRAEIGLMRSLGASRPAIALLFYAENSIVAFSAGLAGYFGGSILAFWLGARIFAGDGSTAGPVLNAVLFPIAMGLAILVAIGGSTPSIVDALRTDPANVLRGDA